MADKPCIHPDVLARKYSLHYRLYHQSPLFHHVVSLLFDISELDNFCEFANNAELSQLQFCVCFVYDNFLNNPYTVEWDL